MATRQRGRRPESGSLNESGVAVFGRYTGNGGGCFMIVGWLRFGLFLSLYPLRRPAGTGANPQASGGCEPPARQSHATPRALGNTRIMPTVRISADQTKLLCLRRSAVFGPSAFR